MAMAEKPIGKYLKRFRDTFNLKQNRIARDIGITPQQYVKYEKDQIEPPTKLIVNLAEMYDVSADYLLGRIDTPQPTIFNEKEVREAFALRDALRRATASAPVPA